jgi:hypothetical protein
VQALPLNTPVAQAVHSNAASAESDLQLMHRRVRVLESALIRAQRAELRHSREAQSVVAPRSDASPDRSADGAKVGAVIDALVNELTDAHKVHIGALCERHQVR